MDSGLILVIAVVVLGLAFEYVNGFHDAANAIATSVATKVLTAKQAVTIAACCDLLGALAGTAVATTIASGLVDGPWAATFTDTDGQRLSVLGAAERGTQLFTMTTPRLGGFYKRASAAGQFRPVPLFKQMG